MTLRTIAAAMLLMIFMPMAAQEVRWALPHISVANVRTEPRHGSELSTQALMGHPVKVTGVTDNGWCEVELPDGYRGFIIDNSLTFLEDKAMTVWRNSDRLIVTAPLEVRVYADSVASVPVSDIVAGDIVEALPSDFADRKKVRLPDGRTGWVDIYNVTPLDDFSRYKATAAGVIRSASALLGVPYLWGGLSSKGLDCSGLTKHAFLSQGLILRRDASQQAVTGTEVAADSLVPGDLIFFGSKPGGRVNHVAVYLGDGLVIESAGRVRVTPLESMKVMLGARRILGNESTDGITPLSSHPWYF